MPIYEYRCTHCGQDFEELVSSSTPDEEVECPSCDQAGAERKFSAFAVGGSPTLGSLGPSALSAGGRACGGGSGFS